MIITDSTAKYQPVLQHQSAIRQTGNRTANSSVEGTGLKLLTNRDIRTTAENVRSGIAAKAEPQPNDASSREITEQAVEKLEKTLSELKHNKLEFTVHEETGRTIVKVVDQDSGEVIKELPPEELLDLAAKLEEMSGVLFDKKI